MLGVKVSDRKKYPVAEANRISKILDVALPKDSRFPVNVTKVAKELTPQFNNDPITEIKSLDFCLDGNSPIDGILVKHQKGKKEAWTIGASIGHNYGRFNFTLGHELGHYMLHRHLSDNFLCGGDDILGNVKQQKEREREADEFASNGLVIC